MALPVREQMNYWGAATAVFFIVLWFLGDVILPFVLGGAIAYFLDPVADRIQRIGLSRAASVVVITLIAILIFVVVVLLVVPTLVNQAVALFEIAPQLARDLQGFLNTHFPSVFESDSALHKTLVSLGETIRERGGQLLETALSSAASMVN